MTKNFALVLLGCLIGGAMTYTFYPSYDAGTANGALQSDSKAVSSELPDVFNRGMERFGPERESAAGGTEAEFDPTVAETTRRADAGNQVLDENGLIARANLDLQRQTGPGQARPVSERRTESQPGDTSRTDPPTLPEAYRDLLRPPSPRQLRPDEIFARFSAETRDDTWAYPMELGINQHIAGASSVVGTVVESVECRSSACVIAGYVQPGFVNEAGDLIRDMAQSGWWQASGATFTSASDNDGVSRFVTIVPRTEADSTESAPTRGSTTRRRVGEQTAI